ncbi:MAG: cohesin domain-containing protein [bacterium]|nr:cohesin domain-containing protein [bacterium]
MAFLLGVLVGGLFGFSVFAAGATLSLSPSSGSYTVGDIFSVVIGVHTGGASINAAEATLNFPSEKLEVVSISKGGSIFPMWAVEPDYSNGQGVISFAGGIPGSSYNGTSGKVLTINFKIKGGGQAVIDFSGARVLAADGKGTDIFAAAQGGSYTLSPAAIKLSIRVPSAPKISSSTHPDPAKWYSLNDAKFSWLLTQDITGASLLVGRIPEVVPTVTYIPPISSREVADLEDGAWYFHVRLQNAAGWGDAAHFRFQIDTTKPERFELQERERDDATDPRVVFLVNAIDSTSDIDHYEFQIDKKEVEIWQDDGTHVYKTSPLDPGNYVLFAKAVDKAGNYLDDSAKFIIEPLAPPTFLDYPYLVQIREPFLVKGETYPNAQVTLLLQREESYVGAVMSLAQLKKAEPQSKATAADQNGNFTVSYEEGLKESGIYKMWVEVVDERGAKSGPTEPLTLKVESPSFLKISSWATKFLAQIILAVALFFFLGFIVWYVYQKLSSWRKRIRKEVKEAEQALHKAIDTLKGEKIAGELKKDLDDVEKFVKKEIKDIEREVD